MTRLTPPGSGRPTSCPSADGTLGLVLTRRSLACAGLAGVLAAGCGWNELPATPSEAPLTAAPGASASTATPMSTARSFTLVATGDVLLHEPLWEQARQDAEVSGQESLDFAPQLASIRPLVEAADIAVCHLETPLAAVDGPYEGYPTFSGPPRSSRLAATGYDACTTASNHTFDQGALAWPNPRRVGCRWPRAHRSARTAEELREPPFSTSYRDWVGAAGLLCTRCGFNGIPYPSGELAKHALAEQRILADSISRDSLGPRSRRRPALGDGVDQDPNDEQLAPARACCVTRHRPRSRAPRTCRAARRAGRRRWVVYGLGNLVAAHATPGEPLREGCSSVRLHRAA